MRPSPASLTRYALALAIFTVAAFHIPFFRHLVGSLEGGFNGVVLFVSTVLLLLALDFLLYYLLAFLLRGVGKGLICFTLFGDAVMLYFVNHYEVLVTDDMMGNVLRTQWTEASGFFSLSFVLYVLALCVIAQAVKRNDDIRHRHVVCIVVGQRDRRRVQATADGVHQLLVTLQGVKEDLVCCQTHCNVG